MLSDESSSDSESGRFKSHNKHKEERSNNSSQKRDIAFGRSSERSRRYDDRFKDLDRKADGREKFESRSRDRHARDRFSRYSPSRRRHSQDRSRNRRSPETRRERHERDFRRRSKQRDLRSNSADKIRCSSRDKHRRSRSRSHKSPTRTRINKEDIQDEPSVKEGNLENKPKKEKSSSPEAVSQKSAVHKPSISVSQKKVSNSPILIEEQASDVSDEVQPGSYYSMIPAIVKDKSEESSEIDSSDDERLRAKLLNLEKELQKTKKKKHKKKHKRKSSKSDKEKNDSSASVEVSSTTDIQEVKPKELIKVVETAEVTSTQKSNQKESSEEGEIMSDDSQSDIDIDPNDLRHKLKRSKIENTDKAQNLDVCGPALPPHFQKSSRKSASPSTEGPSLPPHLQTKNRNIGPSIPEDLRKVLAEKSEDIEIIKSSDDEDGIGPLPAGTEGKWSEAHQRLEERAIEMKIKSLDGHSLQNTNIKTREQWMLELPEGKAKILGLEARSFRAKEGPDMSDRSSWTDTPEDKAKKALGIQKEEDSSITLQKDARARYIENRDEEQEKAVKKHKKKHKREESLLDIHQKKLKKKKKKEEKDDEKKERRPFSRDLDLQVNRFDDAQKKSIIKKAQGLNTRFSSGEAKFL